MMRWFKWFKRTPKAQPEKPVDTVLKAVYEAMYKVPLAFRQRSEVAVSEATFEHMKQLSYMSQPLPELGGRVTNAAYLSGYPVVIDQRLPDGVVTFRPMGGEPRV